MADSVSSGRAEPIGQQRIAAFMDLIFLLAAAVLVVEMSIPASITPAT